MKNKSFERSSFILFVLMMCTNIINYFFQIILAKILPSETAYGEANALLSFISISNVLGTIMALVAAKFSAVIGADERQLGGTVRFILKMNLFLTAAYLLLGGMVFSPLKNYFHISSGWYLAGAGINAVMYLWANVFCGVLQGRQKFGAYGIQGIANSITKSGLSILLCAAGCGIAGVLAASACGVLAALLYALHALKGEFEIHGAGISREERESMIRYAGGMAAVQAGLSLLMNGDILLVRAFFDGHTSGIYASSSVLGKTIIYISGAVVTVLFPMAAECSGDGRKAGSLLVRAFLYGGGISLACAAGLLMLGRPVIQIFFGGRYSGAYEYLPAVCIYIIPVTLLNMIVYFVTAVGKTAMVSAALAAGTAACCIVSFLFHDSVQQMFTGIGAVLGIVFLFILCIVPYILRGGQG